MTEKMKLEQQQKTMYLLQKLKQQTLAQIIGSLLILISGLLVITKISGVAPDVDLINNNWSFYDNWSSYFFLVGAFLYCSPSMMKKLKKLKKSTVSPLLILCTLFLFAPGVSAQNYTKQVEALAESFNTKNIEPVKAYLSADLQFGPIPAANSPAILTNMVTKFPPLNSLKIIESKDGEAIVKYHFVQLGENESSIFFDEEGKITKIEYLEEIVLQQIRTQQRLQNSVQAPKPEKIAFNYSKKSVEFPSKDGLILSADLYEIDPDKPVILLAHQGGYNKYEYADIAPRLNKMGFNALAIDQRSGGSFAGKDNETHERALQNGIENIQLADAVQDMESAIDYLADKYQQKIIVWGSSYSSSLALHVAENNETVKAVISFSPGDYFGEAFPSLKTVLSKIKQPFLVTSSREEADELKGLLSEVDQGNMQLQFIPESDGFHGSKALWIDQEGSDDYWVAITSFLSLINQH